MAPKPRSINLSEESQAGELQKFFVKHAIPIPRSAMDAVMNCQAGAAHLFLENIYSMLTHQKLPDYTLQETITIDDLVAHYALPTTNSMIRQMCGSPKQSRIVFETQKMSGNQGLKVSHFGPQLSTK